MVIVLYLLSHSYSECCRRNSTSPRRLTLQFLPHLLFKLITMQSTLNISPVKDGRRILGDRTPNACLSPARNKQLDAASDISPVKRSLFENHSPKRLLPSPSFVGQKRTIDQVEDDSRINKGNVQVQRVEQVQGNHERNLQDKAVAQATAPKYDQVRSSIPDPALGLATWY